MKRMISLALSSCLLFGVFSNAVYANEDTQQIVSTVIAEEQSEISNDEVSVDESQTDTSVSSEETSSNDVTVIDESVEDETDSSNSSTSVENEVDEVTEDASNNDATDESVEESVEESESDSDLKPVIDKSGRTETGGLHVSVGYIPDDYEIEYIPEFTMQLRSNTGKVLSTVEAGAQNYDTRTRSYNLVFNTEYKLGDEFQLYLADASSAVESVKVVQSYVAENGDLMTETATLKTDMYYSFEIGVLERTDAEDESQPILDLQFTEIAPLTAAMYTDSSKVGILLKTVDGSVIKNTAVKVQMLEYEGQTLELTTGSDGIAWVDRSKLTTPELLVSVKGYYSATDASMSYVKVELPVLSDGTPFTNATVVPAYFDQDVKQGVVTVVVDVTGDTSLSDYWTTTDLTLKDANGNLLEYSIPAEGRTLSGITDGTYTVSVSGKYANIESTETTLTIKNGEGNIFLSVSPKYTLLVGKDSKEYKFAFLNVSGLEGKIFSGTEDQVFAVTPGEAYMVKDTSNGEVTTVSIDSNSFVTRVVLGAGVVFGGTVTLPHTGDAIGFLVGILVVALLGAGASFFIYTKNRKNIGVNSTAMGILLSIALLAQSFSMFSGTAYADIGSGTGASVGIAGTSPKGVIQTAETVSVLQVGFIKSKVNDDGTVVLNEDATLDDMADTFKFTLSNMRSLFYMATNSANDKILRASNSALVTFNTDYGVPSYQSLYGNDPLLGIEATDTTQEFAKRILQPAAEASSSNNAFESFIASTMKSLGGGSTSSSLQLWEGTSSSSVANYGDILGDAVKAMKADADFSSQADAIFQGYTELLRTKLGMTDYATSLEQAYANGQVVLFAQAVPAFYIKGQQSSGYAFMPFHDAVEWFRWGRALDNPTKFSKSVMDSSHEAKVVYGSDVTAGKESSSAAKLAPVSTFLYNVKNTSGKALKPASTVVKISSTPNTASALESNPFAGWGFAHWGSGGSDTTGASNKPTMSVSALVTLVDANGNSLDEPKISIPLEGWSEGSKVLDEVSDDLGISHGMTLTYNGDIYEIVPEKNVDFILKDVADGENINYVWNRSTGVKGGLRTSTIPVPSEDGGSSWEILFDVDIPSLDDLNKYLGGGSTSSLVESKYKGTNEYSHAKLVINLKASKVGTYDTSVTTDREVPQWRLSKYFDQVSDEISNNINFALSLPVETGVNQKLSPTSATFNLVDPDLSNTPWAISSAKLFNGDTLSKQLSALNPYARFWLGGDLLAIKDNSSVSNTKLASWVNPMTLFDGKIGATSQGSAGSSNMVSVSDTLEYGVENSNSFTYSETRQKYKPLYAADGDIIGDSYENYTWSGGASKNYYTSDYNVNVDFSRYLPSNSATPNKYDADSETVNGKHWESYQESTELNVNPEVLMAYDDESGRTSTAFVAGDKLRPILPVTFNVAQFVDIEVDPEVTGMSTSTDTGAKSLAISLNNNNDVILKGSAVTSNFETKGEFQLKTYALDIGNSSLKNAWNPSTTYSTDAINEKFLSKYGTKNQETGKWSVTFTTDTKLKVGDGVDSKEYGGQTQQLTVEQQDESVVSHTLVIRGGKLVSVNGNSNLDSLSDDLKEALTEMKIMGTDNVFNTFESAKGASLTESTVASLGNAMRGTTDLAVGKGWYNEDTTVLVVREYTNTFSLPFVASVDKLPMELDGLQTPVDKSYFFKDSTTGKGGKNGHSYLKFSVRDAYMVADTSTGEFGVSKSPTFIAPNVSVLDVFSTE